MMVPRHDDEPELVPPPELARLRAILGRPPTHATRARHLAAATGASYESSGAAGRFARRGVRAAVAVVASLAITSGLAAAQVLPPPAQRFFSSVSDRIYPSPPEAPPATATDPGVDPERTPTTDPARTGDAPAVTDSGGDPPATTASTRASAPGVTSPTSISTPTAPVTTIPGPGGPGSPDDPTDPGPTDPGTDGGSGEPTDPTTTTTTPGTDGGTTDAGTADATTTTTTPADSGGGGSD
jgi:hypothetical protein